jgi:hypothetical protein
MTLVVDVGMAAIVELEEDGFRELVSVIKRHWNLAVSQV